MLEERKYKPRENIETIRQDFFENNMFPKRYRELRKKGLVTFVRSYTKPRGEKRIQIYHLYPGLTVEIANYKTIPITVIGNFIGEDIPQLLEKMIGSSLKEIKGERRRIGD